MPVRDSSLPLRVKEIPFQPSTLETVDFAMYKFLDEQLDLYTSTNKGWSKVPVIWASAERAYQVKNQKELRDQDGTLILPLITVERSSVVKDLSRKGTVWANVPPIKDEKGGSITIARRIQQEKTSNFANADSMRVRGRKQSVNASVGHGMAHHPRNNKKVVYETITIPVPVYLDITYTISLKTEYQEQMNDLITPFMTRTGTINYFTISHDKHRFESFIQGDVSLDNNISSMESDRRRYETKIDIKTLGYIIGEGKNQEQPKMVVRENAVEVKFPKERVIFGDIPEHIDHRGFYRE